MDIETAASVTQGTAKAILKSASGLTKVYRDGCDWQVIGPNGGTRYFSVWEKDVIGSLKRAVRTVVESAGDTFAEDDIIYPSGVQEVV